MAVSSTWFLATAISLAWQSGVPGPGPQPEIVLEQ